MSLTKTMSFLVPFRKNAVSGVRANILQFVTITTCVCPYSNKTSTPSVYRHTNSSKITKKVTSRISNVPQPRSDSPVLGIKKMTEIKSYKSLD